MSKRSPIRIVSTESIVSWSWKKRVGTFVGSFGVVWLFHEPLSAFGIGSFISTWGVWAYVYLISIAFILTRLIERFNEFRQLGKVSFVSFEIVLEEPGIRLLVEAPQDMRLDIFVKLLLEKISRYIERNGLLAFSSVFNHKLVVKRGHKYRELPNGKTVRDAGLKNGDECKIRIESIRSEIRKIENHGVYHDMVVIEKQKSGDE